MFLLLIFAELSSGLNFGKCAIASATVVIFVFDFTLSISLYNDSKSISEFFFTPIIITLFLFCGTPNSEEL